MMDAEIPAKGATAVSAANHAATDEAMVARPSGGRLRRVVEWMLVGIAIAAVLAFYAWTVEANSGFSNWGELDYYRYLVRGWKKGQLSLDIPPAPELLALADPYDPAQNGPYKLGDATLYRGKYYIYFGAAPALTLMLPYTLLTGREMTMGTAVFVFCCVAFLVAATLWLLIRRRYFPASSVIMAPLGVVAIGLGTHLLSLAQRPMIWELPISSGIAFTISAVLAAYWAMHGRRPVLAMAVAGLLLGLAVGSRPTCLFASAIFLPPLWLAWREKKTGRDWRWMGLAATATLGLCGVAIMAHNYARFDNPLEWGQSYQLSGAYEGKLTHFSLRFLPHNFWVYIFQRLNWTSEFPFALARGIEINDLPGYFGTEEVAGLAVTFPFLWLGFGLPLVLFRRETQERPRLLATLAAIAAYTLPVMALVMCYFSTTTRYQADFAVGLAVLALLGMLSLERWAQLQSPRSVTTTRAAAILLASVTVVVGVFVSFDYHGRSLRMTSPARWEVMERATHQFVAGVGCRLGAIDGPRVLKARFKQQPAGTVETFWRATDPRANERIVVEHIGERLIRFGYARGAEPPAFGRPLRWDHNHTHTVTVQVPSLYEKDSQSWWKAVERNVEFRQRTCVAVWFSGGRALSLIVPALPEPVVKGGEVDPRFTGEIRSIAKRPYRLDEIEHGLAEPHAARGGTLRMRVMFPDRVHEKGEPIFAAGAHYRSSIVFVEAAAGGLRFSFENYTLPRVHSAVFQPRPEGHIVELEMASFRPDAFGTEATGDVVIRLDGAEMMRSRQIAYPFAWGDEQIGHNPFGTTCSAYFRGWIYDARWRW